MYQVTRGIRKGRFFEAQNRSDLQPTRHGGEPRRRTVHHSTDRESEIMQNPWFTDQLGLETRIVVLTIPMCYMTEKNCHQGHNRLRSTL
jgi:hypothetical protein